jgi:Flp pilus assembly protein TadG
MKTRMWHDRRGNIAIIFGLVVMVLALGMGGAVDIAQMLLIHAGLQSGADAAAIAAARYYGTDSAERRTRADNIYLANVAEISSASVGTLSSVGSTWTYTASYPTQTIFLKIIGINTVTLEAAASATASTDTLDVALVLDNSGSMADNNRIVELKKAVKLFLGSFPTGADVQVALVPFDSEVKVDGASLSNTTSNAPANPFAAGTDCSTLVDSSDHAACLIAQSTKPTISCNAFNTSASYYAVSQNRCSSSYNSGGFKAGTTGSYDDCVGWDLLHILCLNSKTFQYTTTDTGSAVVLTRTEWGCTKAILLICAEWGWTNGVTLQTKAYTPDPAKTPQTSKTATNETANANLLLQPTDVWSGCLIDRTQPYDVQNDAPIAGLPVTLYPKANCTVGTLLAAKPLTPMLTSLATAVDGMQPSGATNMTIGIQWGMESLTSSAPFTGSSSSSKKFMIVMTDGLNTQNRWWGDGTASSPNRDKIDARTKLACDNARKYGITVYTINLMQGNADLLSYCATDPTKYFAVTSATQLSDTFLQIANLIKQVRLTK